MKVKTKVVAIRRYSEATERLLDQARALADFILGGKKDDLEKFDLEETMQVQRALSEMVRARKEEYTCQS